jgi:photosystem II stability/assembly factor-like uncharacterized protein
LTAVANPPAVAIGPAELGWARIGGPTAEGAAEKRVRSFTIAPRSPELWAVVVARSGLWISRDAGANWSHASHLPEEVRTVRILNDGAIWAGTSRGIWTSRDGGSTWTDQSKGLEGAPQVWAIDIKPGDPKRLLAAAAPTSEGRLASADGGLGFGLYESKDAAASWTRVGRGFPQSLEYDQIVDILHDPGDPAFAVVALASGEIWMTRSDGAWWEPLSRRSGAVRVICPAPTDD